MYMYCAELVFMRQDTVQLVYTDDVNIQSVRRRLNITR